MPTKIAELAVLCKAPHARAGLRSSILRKGAALDDGPPSPLAILLTTMHRKWDDGQEDEAVALAKAIAPYVHPKAVVGRTSDTLAAMGDEKLDEFCDLGAGGTGTQEQTTQ